jgi:hypothetical protein
MHVHQKLSGEQILVCIGPVQLQLYVKPILDFIILLKDV